MRYLHVFGLLILLHAIVWAGSHFYMQNNKREVLLVVDTSYSMKNNFEKVRQWLNDFEPGARYKNITVGTDKAFLGPIDSLESREMIFRTAFGKLNTDNLANLYSASNAHEKYLLTDTQFDKKGWNVIRF